MAFLPHVRDRHNVREIGTLPLICPIPPAPLLENAKEFPSSLQMSVSLACYGVAAGRRVDEIQAVGWMKFQVIFGKEAYVPPERQ